MAHIGVLKALTEAGVPLDALAGTSGGAIVGVMFAGGVSLERIESVGVGLRKRDMGSISLSRMGLISIRPLQQVLEGVSGPLRLESLQIPMGIIATNLVRREKRIFRTGDAIRAALASASMPHVYRPLEIDGELYTDGGVVEYLPVSALEAYQPLVRVGVHLLPEDRYRTKPRHLGQVMATIVNIVARANAGAAMEGLDVIIRPTVAPYAPFDLTNAAALIEAGYNAARREAPRILALLEERERWMGELGPPPRAGSGPGEGSTETGGPATGPGKGTETRTGTNGRTDL